MCGTCARLWSASRAATAGSFVDASRAYSELLREHIRIEDSYLYPLAAVMLSPAEGELLARRLDAAGRPSGHGSLHPAGLATGEAIGERWRAEVLCHAAANVRRLH